MVQIAPRRKGRQQDSEAEARFQNAIRIVDELPTIMLPKLVSYAMNRISRQLEVSQPPDDERSHAATAASAEVSPYEILKAQGGPFAELIELLNKGQLTDEEEDHMRELAHQQAVGLLADWRPAPTDEDVKRMLDERMIERYGR